MEKALTLSQERNNEIRKLFNSIMSQTNNINKRFLTKSMVVDLIYESPAPRFYISLSWGRILIYERIGNRIKTRRKRDMVTDLFENYKKLRDEYPFDKDDDIIERVLEQPAKSFYVSKHRIREIVYNYSGRNGKRK